MYLVPVAIHRPIIFFPIFAELEHNLHKKVISLRNFEASLPEMPLCYCFLNFILSIINQVTIPPCVLPFHPALQWQESRTHCPCPEQSAMRQSLSGISHSGPFQPSSQWQRPPPYCPCPEHRTGHTPGRTIRWLGLGIPDKGLTR